VGFKTILRPSETTIEIKKSKFIAHLLPVDSEEQAQSFLESVRKKHREATHNVPVYLIGADHRIQRYSDDGEPSGTAGLPVLEMLKKEGITNLAVVITRYFGGTKLGTGGLVRAYTESARAGLEASVVVERRPYCPLEITYDYGAHGKIEYQLTTDEAVILADTSFDARVTVSLYCRPDRTEAVIEQLEAITAGQITIEKGEMAHLMFAGDQYIEEK
jgi:uncharacterized YigZ family protein